MSIKGILFPILLGTSLWIQGAHAQGFLRARGEQIVDGSGHNVLLRGMGLGGWMLQEGYMLGIYHNSQQHNIRKGIDSLIGPGPTQIFYEAWLHHFIQKIDIDSLHAWGFNSVRLPLHYDLFTLPADQEPEPGHETWLSEGFELTDSLLAWCRDNHIYLILDLHAAPGGQGNDLNISDRDGSKPSLWQSEEDQEKTIALWRKLAERYKDNPWIGGYDILNEPNWGFADLVHDPNGLKEQGNAPLKKLLQEITATIRSVDTHHMIIIEGNGWGNNYNGMLPPWDKNMVLSFHKYWNYNRTQDIQHILDTREKYQVPVWVGETGENSNVWFTNMVQLLESHNIGWSMWPLKKMGTNNPLQVLNNPDYDSVRDYLNGRGPRPAKETALKGLKQLSEDVGETHNIYHKDVIDALFRQPYSDKAIPWADFKLEGSLEVPAVDYDLGRNGIAYFDLDTANYRSAGVRSEGNKGRMFRNDGVDIYKDSLSGSYYVGDFDKGEWMDYTIRVAKAGTYLMDFTLASPEGPGKLSCSVGEKSLGEVDIPTSGSHTGGWIRVSLDKVSLSGGIFHFRIKSLSDGLRLKEFRFTRR